MTGIVARRSPSLAERLLAVRAMTERLAEPLSAEDQTVQSMPDVSPTKWHRAHSSWFFEEFLLDPGLPGYQRFDPSFAYLFNSYYDAVGDRHPRSERGLVTRPGIAEIASYRRFVDEALATFMADGAAEQFAGLLELGLHHEQQHQELLVMDIHHVLGASSVLGAYGRLPWPREGIGRAGMRAISGGIVEVGHDGEGFSFDNEGPRHRVLLEPYAISESLISNADFAGFIAAGGYSTPSLWMSEGFATAQAGRWDAPMSWRATSDGWAEHGLSGLEELDELAPVTNLSWFEADAFARFAGMRLPTEAEWEHAAPPPEAAEADGWYGAVWQWTQSPYIPYPGFSPTAGAVGEYNGKFMVNQMVLRGSSLATPPGHARRSYRNFFPAAARWAFSGLRLAQDR